MANKKTLPVSILIAILVGIGVWSYSVIEKNSDKGVYRQAREENSLTSYLSYLSAFPYGKFTTDAEDAICKIINESPIDDLKSILSTVDRKIANRDLRERFHGVIGNIAEQAYNTALQENTVDGWNYFLKIIPNDYLKDANTKMVDAAYADAVKTNTIDGWNKYKSIVGILNYRDADKQIEAIETKQWKNESNAWRLASSDGTIASYNKYLKYHPNGAHAASARKKVIDLEVDGIFAGSHGTLPSMDRSYYANSSSSSVTIHNGTGYTLTIYYSGNTSKKVSIPAGKSSSFTLPNGDYRVAASVSSSSVRSYAGRESLTGGGYEADYYITTSRY